MELKKEKRIVIIVLAVLLTMIAGLTVAAMILRNQDAEAGEAVADPVETIDSEEELSVPLYWVNNVELPSAGGIEIIHSHIPWDGSRRPGEVREIRYLTIHETDNRSSSADSGAHNSLLVNDTSDITGWHYTVDDHSIYHNIPDNEISWNAGDNRTSPGGNLNGIGIEMCVNLTNDFDRTLRNTAALAAELLVTYDLSVEDVHLHADFMDKVCPHRLLSEGRVPEFYEMIRQAYIQKAKEKLSSQILSLPAEAAEKTAEENKEE